MTDPRSTDECSCPTGPAFEGPQEDCEVHGESRSVLIGQRDAARTQLADLRWAEMLTNQACAAGLHADWWVDSEYNHACPWCALAACRAREAAIRQQTDDRIENVANGDIRFGYVTAMRVIRQILDRESAVLGDETGTDKAEPAAADVALRVADVAAQLAVTTRESYSTVHEALMRACGFVPVGAQDQGSTE